MANKVENKVFRARRTNVEYVEGAKLVSSRVATNKNTGEKFDVAIFDNGAEILFPNGWQPLGFDIEFGGVYDCGWQKGSKGGNLFICKPHKAQ